MARETAAKAAREAQEATAKASVAAEAAAATEREVLDVAPIEVQHAPPSTNAATRRYALLIKLHIYEYHLTLGMSFK